MADVTYKLTVFLRLTYDADKAPKVAELTDDLKQEMEDWCKAECEVGKCHTYTTKVEAT